MRPRAQQRSWWGLFYLALLVAYPLLVYPEIALFRLTDISIGMQLTYIFIYAILALGLNVVVGYAGLLHLGIAAFFGIGAYITGILTVPAYPFQLGFPAALALSTLGAALLGLLLGAPTLRLRGDYLAIVTLGFGEVARFTLRNLEEITAGTRGLNPVPSPVLPAWMVAPVSALGIQNDWSLDYRLFYFLSLALLVIVIVLLKNLERSRLGRAWVAIREDELAATCMGINAARVKLSAFALGCGLAGMAGCLYATTLTSTAGPDAFDFNRSIIMLCCVILGGLGSLRGTLLGVFLLIGFDNVVAPILDGLLQDANINPSGSALLTFSNWKLMIFGLALILMMRFRPEGLLPSRQVEREVVAQTTTGERLRGAMALLTLNKLTLRFGGLTAVKDLDCAIDGQVVFSIIGPNGAGKTTVFNAITGIYEPTSGTILFQGRPLRREFTWRVLLAGLLTGVLTGLVAALIALDVNALWRATIKRNYAGPGRPFSYAAAWQDVENYWQGTLAIDAMRGSRRAVRTADGRRTLGYATSQEEAEQMRRRFEKLIAAANAPDALSEHEGKWVVRSAGDAETLATFDARQDAQSVLEKYAAIAREPAARRRNALVALAFGMIVGSAGTWTIWNRARRTPEVISLAGIARTFQNIRLFQNMTVLENVMTGMDRHLRGGAIRMALRLPGVRRQEREAATKARKLLRFVGLSEKDDMLAKNLPYGDQRRLEIARALATTPRLILLDEPAAGMNPAESVQLNRLIEQIRAQGLTVLLIEHHMKVVMGISDRIAVLEYGVKIAEGTPEQVRNNEQVIAAYLGSEEVS